MKKAWLKFILVAATIAVVGCGDEAQRDAASLKDGVQAYSKGDYETALKKFKPLAERGQVEALFNLGVMYRQGQGVQQDEKEAGILFEKAAEQGHVEAQQNLGFKYAKGLGVERDWVQADKWFSIAAASGKETALNNKKVIEVHMPPEKIAEANTLAQEWLAQHKK
ncbi:MAG: sel1 repeat family protein [Nitrosomonadales bacterium]|nr:sel1 repeat family protein [Nitrosomonadales bacterium]